MSYWGRHTQVIDIPTNPLDVESSTRETLHWMIGIARDSAMSLAINDLVTSCLRTLPARTSNKNLIRTIYWWIKNHISFVEDEPVVGAMGYSDVYKELLIYPEVLLSMPHPQGDCDDFSMLFASCMVAAKIPVWYVVVAVDQNNPGKWSHVYCKVCDPDTGEMIPIDCSHGKYVGWETSKDVFRRMEWLVN